MDDVVDYKQEMDEFRENIGELYYERAVKLMEEVEEKRKEEAMAEYTLQMNRMRRSMTKRDKQEQEEAKQKKSDNAPKEGNSTGSPELTAE